LSQNVILFITNHARPQSANKTLEVILDFKFDPLVQSSHLADT
jgi:hypothetical protein